jgi:23S rRNA pseudouridine1911/1915/1917 synthase
MKNPKDSKLFETQKVIVNLNDKSSYFVYKSYGDLAIPIIYEDNHIIAAVKPAGVLSQADSSTKPDMLTILKSYIKEKYNKQGDVFVGLVHRLDCPVSGVMVFARTSKGASRISEQIRGKAVTKKYYAVVQGVPMQRQGRLVDFIAKGKNNTAEHSDEGKESSLVYKTLASDEAKKCSLLEIILETGRTHQIRFQLANIGNPILGERKYASSPKIPNRLYNANLARISNENIDNIFSCELKHISENITEQTKITKISTTQNTFDKTNNSKSLDSSENDIALFSFHFAFKHPTRDINMQIEAVPLYCGYWKMFEEYFNNM